MQRLGLEDLVRINQEYEDEKNRAKTAPEKRRRKQWQAGSVDLKTDRGESIHIHAPGQLWLAPFCLLAQMNRFICQPSLAMFRYFLDHALLGVVKIYKISKI